MRKHTIGLLVVLTGLVCVQAPAKVKEAIIFGGNCEGDHEKNRFRPEMKAMADSLKTNRWNVNVLYDGEQARCEKKNISRDCAHSKEGCCPDPKEWSYKIFGNDTAKVKKGSYQEFLSSLRASADRVKREGGQLLVNINTHGRPKEYGYAHSVCFSDKGYVSIDNPEITEILKEVVNSKDAQLAIIDESCYGGGTVEALEPILGDKACLLAAQGSRRAADFDKGFSSSLPNSLATRNQADLGNAYLDFIKKSSNERLDFHQPVISGDPNDTETANFLLGQVRNNDGLKFENVDESCTSTESNLTKLIKDVDDILKSNSNPQIENDFKKLFGSEAPKATQAPAKLKAAWAKYNSILSEAADLEEKLTDLLWEAPERMTVEFNLSQLSPKLKRILLQSPELKIQGDIASFEAVATPPNGSERLAKTTAFALLSQNSSSKIENELIQATNQSMARAWGKLSDSKKTIASDTYTRKVRYEARLIELMEESSKAIKDLNKNGLYVRALGFLARRHSLTQDACSEFKLK